MDKHYYFLHTASLNVQSFQLFKDGMGKLAAIPDDQEESDSILKYNKIYAANKYLNQLFGDYDLQSTAILKFIEQLTSYDLDICDDITFNSKYPNNVGFLGLNFCNISCVSLDRQICDRKSFINCKRNFYIKLLNSGETQYTESCLEYLYKNNRFESQAITDIKFWQRNNIPIISKITNLISDIEVHPFTGGTGQTEVLKKSQGIASKRITRGHRLVYKKSDNKVTILRAKGHYD